MDISSFWVVIFTWVMSFGPASTLLEKDGQVLRFETYKECEEYMLAKAETSKLTKSVKLRNIANGRVQADVISIYGDPLLYVCAEIK